MNFHLILYSFACGNAQSTANHRKSIFFLAKSMGVEGDEEAGGGIGGKIKDLYEDEKRRIAEKVRWPTLPAS